MGLGPAVAERRGQSWGGNGWVVSAGCGGAGAGGRSCQLSSLVALSRRCARLVDHSAGTAGSGGSKRSFVAAVVAGCWPGGGRFSTVAG